MLLRSSSSSSRVTYLPCYINALPGERLATIRLLDSRCFASTSFFVGGNGVMVNTFRKIAKGERMEVI